MADVPSVISVIKKHCIVGGASVDVVAKNTFTDLNKLGVQKTKKGNVITEQYLKSTINTCTHYINKGLYTKRFPFTVVKDEKSFKWVAKK